MAHEYASSYDSLPEIQFYYTQKATHPFPAPPLTSCDPGQVMSPLWAHFLINQSPLPLEKSGEIGPLVLSHFESNFFWFFFRDLETPRAADGIG